MKRGISKYFEAKILNKGTRFVFSVSVDVQKLLISRSEIWRWTTSVSVLISGFISGREVVPVVRSREAGRVHGRVEARRLTVEPSLVGFVTVSGDHWVRIYFVVVVPGSVRFGSVVVVTVRRASHRERRLSGRNRRCRTLHVENRFVFWCLVSWKRFRLTC